MLLLNNSDIQRALRMTEAIAALRAMLAGTEKMVAPPRMIIDNEEHGALSLFMPALLSRGGHLGIKVSSIYPNNRRHGLPTINGVVVLLDSASGRITAMLDSAALTSIRTSAVSALAVDLLAPQQAGTLAIIGVGVQARAHLLALSIVRKFNAVKVFGRDAKQTELFVEEMSGQVAVRLTAAATLADAIADADVICMATSHTGVAPILLDEYLKPQVHINAIGGGTVSACECDPLTLRTARVYVDEIDTALRESGGLAPGGGGRGVRRGGEGGGGVGGGTPQGRPAPAGRGVFGRGG
ncbi:ornithine cyclodeaminase family protein, partial [Undibacterium sp. CCC1.1]